MNLLLTKWLQLSIIIIISQLLLADQKIATNMMDVIWDKNHKLMTNCTFYDTAEEFYQNRIHHNISDLSKLLAHDFYNCGGRVGKAEDVATVLVRISSDSSLFASSHLVEGVKTAPNDTDMIPCTLKMGGEEHRHTNKDDDAVKPKENITLSYNLINKRKFAICNIGMMTGIQETVVFDVRTKARPTYLIKPVLTNEPSYVVRTGGMLLECKLHILPEWDYELVWTTPKKTITKTLRKNQEELIFPEYLIVENITTADAGNYTCTWKTANMSKSTSLQITINDPEDNFIHLKPAKNETNYEKPLHENVTWVVKYHGHPNATIEWLDPQNTTITNITDKYEVHVTKTETSLIISNLEFNDMGVYTLVATSGHKQPKFDTKTFNLTIWSKPILMKKAGFKDYYDLNEEAEFICNFEGFPQQFVTWDFREYSDQPQIYKVPKYNHQDHFLRNDSVWANSTYKMKIEKSGNISCYAYNARGNYSFQHPIIISDVPNGFGIIAPPEEIIVGDDIELKCRASTYHFTDSIDWKLGRKSIDMNSKVRVINRNRTQFSYESILRINTIDKSYNNMNVICEVITHEGEKYTQEKQLIVKVAATPKFTNTNMKGTEYTYDGASAHTIIKLRCYVSGVPRPVVSWFKDNRVLQATENLYKFTNENQELEIIHPHASDSGEYTCKAKNRINTIEKHQKIRISGEEVSKTLIISIVILLILCVILVIYFSIKMHREKIVRKQLMDAGLIHFDEGALQYLNPALTVDDQADLLPYDKKWEFPRERLKFGRQLGSGAFGVVMKAQAERICKNELSTTVAVKMVKCSTESTFKRALASELKIMVHLGKHLNVVNLLGACTRNIAIGELLVIVEYCRYGNLHDYLLRHRSDFINQIDQATKKIDLSIGRELLTKPVGVDLENSRSTISNTEPEPVSYVSGDDSQDSTSMADSMHNNTSAQPGWRSNYYGDYEDQNLKPICTQDLLSWAFQVARGMEYLSQRKILHGDLAARNILLAENGIVKICDFGLARTMYSDENYEKKGEALLPIKWMAIESIRDRIFSTQSDVWSFGIVLWEFFTLAETPYATIGAEKQYLKLVEGYRMGNPEFSPDDVYDIMLKCWDANPSERPTFTDLVQKIGDLLDENVRTHYLDLNAPYVEMNAKTFGHEENDYLTMMSAPDHKTLSSFIEREYVNLSNISSSSDSGCSFECSTPSSLADDTRDLSVIDALNTTIPDSPLAESKFGGKFNSERVTGESATVVEIEGDICLKPINVQERRAVSVQQPQAIQITINDDESNENDSGYCNSSMNSNSPSHMVDSMNIVQRIPNEEMGENNFNDLTPSNIKAHDRYVNMPHEKMDWTKDAPNCFTNPSYLFMANMEEHVSRR